MEGDAAALQRALHMLDQLGSIWTKETEPVHFAYAAINKVGARRQLAANSGNYRHLQAAVAELYHALPLFSADRNPVLNAELLHVLGNAESDLGSKSSR